MQLSGARLRPAVLLKALEKGYVTLLADGERMREIGIEAWIAEQEAREATGFAYSDIRCEPYQVPKALVRNEMSPNTASAMR